MADPIVNPTTVADAAPPVTGATSSNPGNVGQYAPNTPGADVASQNATVFSGLVIPSTKLSANTPRDFNAIEVPTHINGSPSAQGVVKGNSKAPNIDALSQLVKLATAVGESHPLDGFSSETQAALAKAFNVQQVAALNNGTAPPALQDEALSWAWKSIVGNMKNLGISTTSFPGVKTPPTTANVISKLKELGSVPLEFPLTNSLDKAGYDTKGMTNVQTLVAGHDSAEFDVTKVGQRYSVGAGPGTDGKQSLAQHYDEFINDWNDDTNGFRKSWTTALVGAGALDISSGNPTAPQVESATQSLFRSAATDNLSISAEFTKLDAETPAGPNGTNINTENLNQADVLHYANQLIGANILTPYQATTLANVVHQVGSGSGAATDMLNQGIIQDYTQYIAKGGAPITSGGSFAASAYQQIQDGLTSYGIQATPTLINQLLLGVPGQKGSGVLMTGVNTPYELSTLSQTATEGYAKANIGHLYGEGVEQQVKAGVSVAAQAKPYQAAASALLGIPETEMDIADPTGKWMTWSQGGTGPGGVKTQQEYTKELMTDPQFGFQGTQQGQAELGTMVAGMAALLGRAPQGGGSGTLTGAGSNLGQGQSS